MLVTQLKPYDEIRSLVGGKTVVVRCRGCDEVYFPGSEFDESYRALQSSGAALAAISTDLVCSPDNIVLYLQKNKSMIESADTLLVFSCGVGVQVVAELLEGMPVYAACDTYPLPGWQGLTPLEYDCALCGECLLNDTGGICPITACSKSLVNGQCGGSKNGKCEIDKGKDCGWERINRRLKAGEAPGAAAGPVFVRNYGPQEYPL